MEAGRRTPEIILALNTREAAEALGWVQTFAGRIRWFKVGLPLFVRYGPEFLFSLREQGAARIFLDLKMLDIPSVLEGAVMALRDLPVEMVTVSLLAGPEAVIRVREAAPPEVMVVGVTVLSSQDAASIAQILPQPVSVQEWSLHLARMAVELKLPAVVASGDAVARIRDRYPELRLVVPGIRWEEDASDQKRVLTPREAARAGVAYIVVGRPLTHAPDPLRALQELEEALLS